MGTVTDLHEFKKRKEEEEQRAQDDYIKSILQDNYDIMLANTDFLIYNNCLIDDDLIEITIVRADDEDGEDNLQD